MVEHLSRDLQGLSSHIGQTRTGSEEQLHRVYETVTFMRDMTASVLDVARSSSHAASATDMARQKAELGAGVVMDAVTAIERVQNQALSLKIDIDELGKQAIDIGQIMQVIEDIADQTNLLALNAAIEAARAGDAGRGFAVVADEVRKLAEKTMVATQEVGRAINAIQSGTRTNIGKVEDAVDLIGKATKLAEDSGGVFKGIVELVDSSASQVEAIASASEEQSVSSEEINRSVEGINKISSGIAEAMIQALEAVSDIEEQSKTLQTLTAGLHSERW